MNEILLAKALANFLHREIIEDYHVKYNISQKDMEIMNRKAVDRAKISRKFCQNLKNWKLLQLCIRLQYLQNGMILSRLMI